MPRRGKIETRTGAIVEVEIERGREYDRRVELTYEDRVLLFGVDEIAGRVEAELLVAYDEDGLSGIGEDASAPGWAADTLDQMEIREVRA